MPAFEHMAQGIDRLKVPFGGCWTGIVLVRSGGMNILVDSGAVAQDVDGVLVPALRELGIELSGIDVVALTHTHGDHVGGCARIRALHPRVRFAVYEGALDQMRDPLKYNRRIRSVFPEDSAPPAKVLEGCEPDILVPDGGKMGPLTLLHTPGHDQDACCWLEESTGTLMTGDSLQLDGTVVQGCALIMYLPEYERSLDRLCALPVENILAGHEYLPLGDSAIGRGASRAYLEACRRCVERDTAFVRSLLANGTDDVKTVARALIREVGGREPEYLFLPMYTAREFIRKGKGA